MKTIKPIKAWAVYNTFVGEVQTKPFNTISHNKKEVIQYFYYLEALLPGTFQIIPVLISPLNQVKRRKKK